MASPTVHQLVALLLGLALPAAMSSCASEVFPSGKSYVTCRDLPKLGAALHWTYYADDASSRPPSLSLAFVAAPAAPGGWVAWGINPTATGNGNGMVGTQALLAFVAGGAASAPTVRTYNITSYYAVGAASTPIAFPAASSSLAADVGSGGRIRLYATLQLGKGMEVVNQVWQVGSSVTRGAPDVHAMAPENLAARGKLVLSVGTAAASPPAHAGGPSGDRSSSWPPSGRQMSRAAGADIVTATANVVLALLGFWTMVGYR